MQKEKWRVILVNCGKEEFVEKKNIPLQLGTQQHHKSTRTIINH
jgi:hypothetical protein